MGLLVLVTGVVVGVPSPCTMILNGCRPSTFKTYKPAFNPFTCCCCRSFTRNCLMIFPSAVHSIATDSLPRPFTLNQKFPLLGLGPTVRLFDISAMFSGMEVLGECTMNGAAPVLLTVN